MNRLILRQLRYGLPSVNYQSKPVITTRKFTVDILHIHICLGVLGGGLSGIFSIGNEIKCPY